jgi:tetratricopeptide (TPR) repeat protein
LDLGIAYCRKGMFNEALKMFNELITMNPNMASAYFQRAGIYQYANPPYPQLAAADYTRSIQLNPSYSGSYMNRGVIYVDQLSKYDSGISDYNKALQIDPANIDAVIDKGIAYYKKGDYDAALSNYLLIKDKAHYKGKLYYLMALSYAGKKDYKNALQYAQQAQKLGTGVDTVMIQGWRKEL